MYQNKPNAIQRARICKGLTQEALAERAGYSVDSIRAWESGARIASLEALDTLQVCLDAPWLPGVYLREQTNALNHLLPEFEVGRPLSEAAAEYICCLLELIDKKVDRTLLRMVADGKIDEVEREVYEDILSIAARANKAYFEMLYSKKGGDRK